MVMRRQTMRESFQRRDPDKEERLYHALGCTLNNFIMQEPSGVSNGVIMAAMEAFFGNAMAYMCATSIDSDEKVRERLALVQAHLDEDVWCRLRVMRNDHEMIMRTQPGWGEKNPARGTW